MCWGRAAGAFGDWNGGSWGRAGEGNRTLVLCLEGSSSTIELHPRLVMRVSEFCVGLKMELADAGNWSGWLSGFGDWGVQDSNLRRHSHLIYSQAPLTARETPLVNSLISARDAGDALLVLVVYRPV